MEGLPLIAFLWSGTSVEGICSGCLRCEKCGGKEVGLAYSPRGNDHRRPGSNAYEKAKGG